MKPVLMTSSREVCYRHHTPGSMVLPVLVHAVANIIYLYTTIQHALQWLHVAGLAGSDRRSMFINQIRHSKRSGICVMCIALETFPARKCFRFISQIIQAWTHSEARIPSNSSVWFSSLHSTMATKYIDHSNVHYRDFDLQNTTTFCWSIPARWTLVYKLNISFFDWLTWLVPYITWPSVVSLFTATEVWSLYLHTRYYTHIVHLVLIGLLHR